MPTDAQTRERDYTQLIEQQRKALEANYRELADSDERIETLLRCNTGLAEQCSELQDLVKERQRALQEQGEALRQLLAEKDALQREAEVMREAAQGRARGLNFQDREQARRLTERMAADARQLELMFR